MKTRALTFSKSWSTHMPMLIKYVQATDGPVLELGSGLYSTPLLHWLCAESRRMLVTHETDPEYFERASRYKSRTHSIVENLDSLPDVHWGVVFVDGDTNDRANFANRFKDCADFVILHDTQEKDEVYHYSLVYPNFKHRFDWKFCTPWTTVLSNFKEL